TYRQLVHARAGEVVTVPYVGTSPTPSRDELALFEVNGDMIRADRFDALAVRDGLLELRGLAAGDYDLWLKRTGERVRVRVVGGALDRDGRAAGRGRRGVPPRAGTAAGLARPEAVGNGPRPGAAARRVRRPRLPGRRRGRAGQPRPGQGRRRPADARAGRAARPGPRGRRRSRQHDRPHGCAAGAAGPRAGPPTPLPPRPPGPLHPAEPG